VTFPERGGRSNTTASLRPFHPHEAVGGRPAIVRDSIILAAVDTFGQASFIGRNPRTAAGIANTRRRVLLVAVDGRQKGYSAGMSLRELATLMRALGARDAINLDGGGSTTLVVADPHASGALRIANQPSDSAGERAVGDALAIVRRAQCRR
jgi:exopolysaccharide biosynthesis protein